MKILFICTHNRCRSILAEAITKKNAQSSITVKSAGSQPAGKVHNNTLLNLTRRGYEVDDLISQSWDDMANYNPDITITVCDKAAQEACPLWLGNAIKIHWGLSDPTAEKISEDNSQVAFDKVINTIEKRIDKLCQYNLEQMTDNEIEKIFNKIGEIV